MPDPAPAPDLTTPEGVAHYMRQATSTRDWGERCDAVKDANNGDYPPFWYDTIIRSGLAAQILGDAARIRIICF